MGQQGFRDVDGDAAEEDEEHEEPFEVLAEGAEEGAFADPVAHGGEGDVAEAVEDDDQSDPDVPGVDVVLVDIWTVALACMCKNSWRSSNGDKHLHPLYHPIRK